MNRKNLLKTLAIIIALAAVWCGYNSYISSTRIAVVNFPDFTVEKLIRSNNNNWVKIKNVELNSIEKIKNYDMVLVRIHGVGLEKRHFNAIQNAMKNGVTVYSTEADNMDINSLKGNELKYISTLIENGSVKNYQSLFNYARAKIDKKPIFNKPYYEPIIVPNDYFFHTGEDQFFATYSDYQKFYQNSGKYRDNAPRVAILAGNINMQNSNSEHFEALINSLEEKGLNVYPINSFGSKKLVMLDSVKPNIILNRPHGRLIMGGGDSGIELLNRLNAPILAPITIDELYDKWIKDKQGMSGGALTAMSVVLPELDGAIVPFAVAAQFERNGMKIFDAIPEHTEKFCRIVKNFTNLQTKPNRDKKVAIYYFKSVGKGGSLSASELEVVQSLYNTLKLLKDNGYSVKGLPNSAEELDEMIKQKGAILGSYAMGAYDEFIKKGDPALVDVKSFEKWEKSTFPQQLIDEVEAQYGKAPGKYMNYEKNGEKYIAVSRIELGNVTILPQPLPSEGGDENKIVHGVAGAPAYPFLASYLWTKNEFKADALIHFGTHGSLEFIPGKQIGLSNYDWSDLLVGDMPHFYIYTINNTGEGIIAKRRSYATLISHLTAPFMKSEIFSNLKILEDKIHSYQAINDGNVKQRYREAITDLSKKENLLSTLSLDSTKTLNDEDIDKVHQYLEEVNDAKVADGLYTLGEPYSKENVKNTAYLMSIDPIRYSLATLDMAHGKIDAKKLDDISFVNHKYTVPANQIISRAMNGESPEKIFKSVVSPNDLPIIEQSIAQKIAKKERMKMMMRMMASQEVEKTPKFLDSKGDIIPEDTTQKENSHGKMAMMTGKKDGEKEKKPMSMMERMAQAKSIGLDESKDANELKQNTILYALKNLKETIEGVAQTPTKLVESTKIEQDKLLNALNGGYINPSSGGDPIINSKSVPTGRNLYSINPENTPSAEAWKVGKKLAENLLAAELKAKGKYPEKIAFTLWSNDFIDSEGATIAEIFYLLGVEPLRDGFGSIRSVRVIPAKKLGRPRIDVVVQTSGQLRDIAASRLNLVNQAIAMAAQADDNNSENYVAKGLKDAETRLLEKGFSPADARKYAKERIFGGVNGNYGTGIMGMVESGDSWTNRSEIAKQYIQNMGATYSGNGTDQWGAMKEGVFEAALLNTTVVVQPRSSNTWGPLSLDHVYEFMGGLSAAVEEVTGNDPTGYFNDFRNHSHARVQELKEAIGVEVNSTILNPKFIKEKLNGKSSSISSFAETIRNTYGWNSMKPTAIDQHLWNKYYDVFIKDEYNLGLQKAFDEKDPYALQEITAVMLESARKGLWKATPEQIKETADLHTKTVTEYGAACSGFVCDNTKLRNFVAEKTDAKLSKQYSENIDKALKIPINSNSKTLKLEKEQNDNNKTNSKVTNTQNTEQTNWKLWLVIGILLFGIIVLIAIKRKK